MGTRASKVGVQEVRNASPNALANAFAELSDSEREWPNEWAMAVLPTVNVSADPKACCSLSFVPRLLKLLSTFNKVNQMMFQWDERGESVVFQSFLFEIPVAFRSF